jgi:hypothetical protein
MALTSKFSINGADTISGELVNPINWQNAFVNLSFDKDSVIAKSKGVVSTTEWEWISKTAKFLSDYQKDGLTGGFGVLIGVPFQWELTDSGSRSVIFNGYLDLSGATFECDKVTTPSRERAKIDDLNSKVDSFTYEYLLSQGLLSPVDYTYVPYAKLPVQNLGLEIVVSTVQLIILIIELQQAISALVQLVIGMATFTWADFFKAVIQTAYTAFLTFTVVDAAFNILKLIIQPIKYHAGMTELRLMEVGAEYLGYEFASSILEEDFPTAVIIPEKWNIQTQEDDNLVTGFTTVSGMVQPIDLNLSNHLEQNGYYNGTFGDVIRALKIKYNAKVIIEDSTTGGLPILRFERQDYIADASQLYEIPAIDNNDRFTLNADEFKANYLIEYQLDSSNKACYTDYNGTVYQSTVTPNITIPENVDLNLMKGLDNRLIPFAKGVRKNELTKVEKAIDPLLTIIIGLFSTIVYLVNGIIALAYIHAFGALTNINLIIGAVNGLPLINANIPLIDVDSLVPLDEIPTVDMPNLLDFSGDRIGAMQVENDFLNVPHNVILNNFAGEVVSTDPIIAGAIPYIDPASGNLIDYVFILDSQTESGNFLGNRLVEDHVAQIGAKNLWDKYHYINSFVPTDVADTDDNPLTPQLHNQWKLYEFDNVPFCYEDYLKVKGNNNITFAGEIGRIESLEWDVYNQTAKISFRVNELWTANLKVQNNEPIGR